jgi:hypothetical protein
VALQLLHLRVRAAVLSAVSALTGRRRTIVTRCDLRREKHAAVARELGICLRHFYRERRAALTDLLAAVEQRLVTTPATVGGTPSRFELDLDRVTMLRLAGRSEDALVQIARVAESAGTPADEVRAWCYAVELAADADDTERARGFLRAALRIAREVADDDTRFADVAADVEMASAFVAWQGRSFDDAALAIERAVAGVRRVRSFADKTRARAAAGILFRGSELSCLRGRPREGLERLSAARTILDAMPHRPPDLTAQLFLESSVLHGLVWGGARRALDYGGEAFEAYRALGDGQGVSAAAGVLSSLHAAAGDGERAVALGTFALELARTHGDVADVADKALILSQATTAAGDAKRGLALARWAAAHASGGLYETRSLLAAAEARLRAGDAPAALADASTAARVADDGWDRYQGVALRLEAEAHDLCGDRRAAADCITRAVSRLERHGHPALLARAYACSARLVGNSEHARLAREFDSDL